MWLVFLFGLPSCGAGLQEAAERIQVHKARAFDLAALAIAEILHEAAPHPVIHDRLCDAGETAGFCDANPLGLNAGGGWCFDL